LRRLIDHTKFAPVLKIEYSVDFLACNSDTRVKNESTLLLIIWL
jgi:hypothetical protein